MVDVTPIPYHGNGCIITILSRCGEDIADILQCTCSDFAKMSSLVVGKKGQWVSCEHLYYVFMYLCKIDYATNKFIHAATFSYTELMQLLELASVAK